MRIEGYTIPFQSVFAFATKLFEHCISQLMIMCSCRLHVALVAVAVALVFSGRSFQASGRNLCSSTLPKSDAIARSNPGTKAKRGEPETPLRLATSRSSSLSIVDVAQRPGSPQTHSQSQTQDRRGQECGRGEKGDKRTECPSKTEVLSKSSSLRSPVPEMEATQQPGSLRAHSKPQSTTQYRQWFPFEMRSNTKAGRSRHQEETEIYKMEDGMPTTLPDWYPWTNDPKMSFLHLQNPKGLRARRRRQVFKKAWKHQRSLIGNAMPLNQRSKISIGMHVEWLQRDCRICKQLSLNSS